MYLSQTKMELYLTKKYDLNGQEVYLTKAMKGCSTQRFACLFQLWKNTKQSFGLRLKNKSTN